MSEAVVDSVLYIVHCDQHNVHCGRTYRSPLPFCDSIQHCHEHSYAHARDSVSRVKTLVGIFHLTRYCQIALQDGWIKSHSVEAFRSLRRLSNT